MIGISHIIQIVEPAQKMSLRTPSKSHLPYGKDKEPVQSPKTPERTSSQRKHKWFNTMSPLKWGRLHEQDSNGSPKEITRRKSVKGLFSSIRSPRVSVDVGPQCDSATGKCVPLSPSKENAGFFSRSLSSPKRRKSFSDIFGTIAHKRSLSRINSIPPRKSVQQEKPDRSSTQDVLDLPQNTDVRRDMPVVEESSIRGYLKPHEESIVLTKEPTTFAWGSLVKEVTVSQTLSPHTSPQMAASESDTLSPCKEVEHADCDENRPRTPDSYLAQLVESHEAVQNAGLDDLMSPAPSTRIALPVVPHPYLTQDTNSLIGLNVSQITEKLSCAGLKTHDESLMKACDSSSDPNPKIPTTRNPLTEINSPVFFTNDCFSLPTSQVEDAQLAMQGSDYFSQPPSTLRAIGSQHQIELQDTQLTAGDIAYGQEITRARNIRLTVDNMTKNYYSRLRHSSPNSTGERAQSQELQNEIATIPAEIRSPILRGRQAMNKDRPWPRLRDISSPVSSRRGLSLERLLEQSSELRSSSNTAIRLRRVSITIDLTKTPDPTGMELSNAINELPLSKDDELLSAITACKSIPVPNQARTQYYKTLDKLNEFLSQDRPVGLNLEFVPRTQHQINTGHNDALVAENSNNKKLRESQDNSPLRTEILSYNEEATSVIAKLEKASEAQSPNVQQSFSYSKPGSDPFSSGNEGAFNGNDCCQSSEYEMFMAHKRSKSFWLQHQRGTSMAPPLRETTVDMGLIFPQQVTDHPHIKTWVELGKEYLQAEKERLACASAFHAQSNQGESSRMALVNVNESHHISWRRPEEYATYKHVENISKDDNTNENVEGGTPSEESSDDEIYGLSPAGRRYAMSIEAWRGKNESSANEHSAAAVEAAMDANRKQTVIDLAKSTDYDKSPGSIGVTLSVPLQQDLEQNSSNLNELCAFYSQFAEIAKAESDISLQEKIRRAAAGSGYGVTDPVYHKLKMDMIKSWNLRHAFLGNLEDCRDKFPAIYRRIVRDIKISPLVKDWFLAEQAVQAAPGPARLPVTPGRTNLLHVFLLDRQNAPDTSKLTHENLRHVFLFDRPNVADSLKTIEDKEVSSTGFLNFKFGYSALSAPKGDCQHTPEKASITGTMDKTLNFSARYNAGTNLNSVINPTQTATKRALSDSMVMAGAIIHTAKKQNLGVPGLVTIFEAKGLIPKSSGSRLQGGASFASSSRATPLPDHPSTIAELSERPPSSIDNDDSLEDHSLISQYKQFQAFDFGFSDTTSSGNILGGSTADNSFQELTNFTDGHGEATRNSSDEQDAALYG